MRENFLAATIGGAESGCLHHGHFSARFGGSPAGRAVLTVRQIGHTKHATAAPRKRLLPILRIWSLSKSLRALDRKSTMTANVKARTAPMTIIVPHHVSHSGLSAPACLLNDGIRSPRGGEPHNALLNSIVDLFLADNLLPSLPSVDRVVSGAGSHGLTSAGSRMRRGLSTRSDHEVADSICASRTRGKDLLCGHW